MLWKTLITIFLLIGVGIITETTANITCYVGSSVNINRTQSGCKWCVIQNLNGFVNRSCMDECPKGPPMDFSGIYLKYCCQINFCNGSDRVGFRLAAWSIITAFGVSMFNR
ncbi:hypothetical protein EG68_11039 [Paragonimus skrjabini miyazakii]|uniref:Uncharacterized protein n=1 Tax=Paragonimus skrjabini miyazakii TaxID=59628 RepID=A0A8S9YHN6_9TREM|nr:hypothetical protein EG68_11039 [Paragonimus skrjabini miyazakii]